MKRAWKWFSGVHANTCCKRLFQLIGTVIPWIFTFCFPVWLEHLTVTTHSCCQWYQSVESCAAWQTLHKHLCHSSKIWYCLASPYLKGQPRTWWLQNQLGMLSTLSVPSELDALCLLYVYLFGMSWSVCFEKHSLISDIQLWVWLWILWYVINLYPVPTSDVLFWSTERCVCTYMLNSSSFKTSGRS